MKMSFAGGTDAVGSLGMLLDNEEGRYLFDYGLTPAKPPRYPIKVPATDALFITHSHLDHVGMAPWLCGEYGTSVWGTELTLEISTLLLEDCIKVAKLENYPIPYDMSDVRRFVEESTIIRHGEKAHLGDLIVRPIHAGHIPGSSMYRIETPNKDIVFTGDINTIDTQLQTKAHPPKCQTLIMESTYAGRPHPPRKKVEEEFISKVEDVLDRGGTAIVPAFAVGRTQEVIQVLSQLDEEMWLDGMGRRVSQIYLKHPECIRDPRGLKKAIGDMNFVKTPLQREKALDAPIVVTTSGMLDGGPVMNYLKKRKNDKKSAILLTGYQVEDTNGRMLMDTGSIELEGELHQVLCEVCQFDFSAHAGHDELVRFAEGSGAEVVILVHGDQRSELEKDISRFAKVLLPTDSDIYEQ